MTTKEAFNYVLENDNAANKYRLSKNLLCSNTTIHNYVIGKSNISEDIYNRFRKIYPSIEISDVYKLPKYKLGAIL